MKPRETRTRVKRERCRSRLDQIIDMQHQLLKQAPRVIRAPPGAVCGSACRDSPGLLPLLTRLFLELAILKFTLDLPDEML